jgi:nucleoside-diphosphate-sugar epimerase
MSGSLTGRRVVLIGGAGFIGHNLAIELKSRGAEVHIVDSLQVNNLGAFSNSAGDDPAKRLYMQLIYERLNALREINVPLHVTDARDYQVLSRCLSEIKPNAIVQLAAIAHANRANKDPFSTFDHSFRTLENALDCARGTGAHFIYFSSSMVYGNFDGEAVSEERHCDPMGIYGALKYGGEKLVIAYNQVFDLPYTIVRPSALYGERCVSRRVGQAFIENAVRGLPLTVNGDGSDGLDFTYISDLVQGVRLCIENPAARNQTLNLTYGGARTLNQMIEIMRANFPGIEVKYQPRDGLMPERGTLSVDKARKLIGYEPAFPLEKGFPRYIEWYKGLARQHPEYFKAR